MQVIFCHIPSKTSLRELVQFAESTSKLSLPFLRKPNVVSYEILEISDSSKLHNEFHGLVTYATPKDAEKAIKLLNGKKIGGKVIEVRPYVHRSPGDKRINRNSSGLNRPENLRRASISIHKRSEDSPKVSAYKHNRIHNGGG